MLRVAVAGLFLPLCAAFLGPMTPHLRGSHVCAAGSFSRPVSASVLGHFKPFQASRRPQSWFQRCRASGAEAGEESQDELIERLASAPPYELPGIVAKVSGQNSELYDE
jgi:hypothetical protein